jgi:hypothetical protein
MPNYEVKVTRRVAYTRHVTEELTFVVEADSEEQARDVVEDLDEVDSSPLDDLDWKAVKDEACDSTLLEDWYGDPVPTDKPADLKAVDIL